jgi:excisionase family DNA binding protein
MNSTDSLFQTLEAACEAAIRKVMNITDGLSRRLLTVRNSAEYLALSEREIYNMISEQELVGVRHGRRLMLDIRDLDEWIASHKLIGSTASGLTGTMTPAEYCMAQSTTAEAADRLRIAEATLNTRASSTRDYPIRR